MPSPSICPMKPSALTKQRFSNGRISRQVRTVNHRPRIRIASQSSLFFGVATTLCYCSQRSFRVHPELRKKHEVSYEAAGFFHPTRFVGSDRNLPRELD